LAEQRPPPRRGISPDVFDLLKVAFYLVACGARPAAYLWWKSVGFRLAGALGAYEAAHFRFLESVLPRGGRFVDVGAHYGVYTRFLLDRAGAEGAVFAFEPHPGVFAGLQRRFENRPNCHLRRLALSSRRRDDLYLCVPKLHGIVPEPALSHLSTTPEPEAIAVEVCRLDDFAAELGKIDFIKVDVEGGELDFFEGASETIATHRPLVLFECMDMDRRYDVIRRFADPRRYHVGELDAQGRLRHATRGGRRPSDVNFYLLPDEFILPDARADTR